MHEVAEDHLAVAVVVHRDPSAIEEIEVVGRLARLYTERRELGADRVRVERFGDGELRRRGGGGRQRHARKQQGTLRIAHDLAFGLRRDCLRARDRSCPDRVVTAHQREREQRKRCDEERRAGDQRAAEASVLLELAALRASRFVDTRGQEVPLGRVQPAVVRCRPLDRRVESSAAVEVGRLPPRGLPEPGGVAEPPMQAYSVAVLLQPPPQSRPAADEHLVRDLGGAVIEDHEPGRRQPPEQRLDRLGGASLRNEVLDQDPPAGVLGVVADLGQA